MTTELEKASVDRVLSAFGLGKSSSFRRIEAGTVNTNFKVDTDRGPFFLRINQGKSEDDVAYEATLIAELVARGVRTPRPVSAVDGRGYVEHDGVFFSFFPFKRGKHIEPTAGGMEKFAAAVGNALRVVHDGGAQIQKRFERESRYHSGELFRRFQSFRGHPETASYESEIQREFEWLDSQSAIRAQGNHSVIHGDLFPDNVLFDGGDIWLLDFEQASTGSTVYDVAVLLNAWCFDATGGKLNWDLARAMLKGYGKRVPADVLAVELRAAAHRFIITRITDVLLTGADRPGKGFREYVARLSYWRGTRLDAIEKICV